MRALTLIICFVVIMISCSRQHKEFNYWGAASPGAKLEIFGQNIVSMPEQMENALTISPKGDEVFSFTNL